MATKEPLVGSDGDKPAAPEKPAATLGLARLVAIIFVSVSGGAYGTEGSIQFGGGGLWMFIACVVYPLFWGLPVALAVAELACALPTNSAVIGWVNCCMPPWCTCCMGLWTVTLAIVDNSLYPAFFYAYLSSLVGEFSQPAAMLIKTTFSLFSCALNIIGVEFIGSCSVLLAVNAVLPFLVLSLWGIPSYKPENWFTSNASRASFAQFIGTTTWNFTGYDQAGFVAAEVDNPGKIFSKAVWIALFLPSISYILPFVVGLSVVPFDPNNEDSWSEGEWTNVADAVAGNWLKTWLGIGALVTTTSYMLAYICTTSRALQLTSQVGVGPRIVAKYLGGVHPRFGTPHVAVVTMSLIQLPLCLFLELDKLLALDAIMYSLKVFGIVASFCLLRRDRPFLHRPYRMFGNKWTLGFQFTILVLWALVIIVYCSLGNYLVLGITFGIVFGIMGFSIIYTKIMRPEGYSLPEMDEMLDCVDPLLHSDAVASHNLFAEMDLRVSSDKDTGAFKPTGGHFSDGKSPYDHPYQSGSAYQPPVRPQSDASMSPQHQQSGNQYQQNYSPNQQNQHINGPSQYSQNQQGPSHQYQQNNGPNQYPQSQQNASPQYQQNNGPNQYPQNQQPQQNNGPSQNQNPNPQYQQNYGPSQQNASPQYQQNNGPSQNQNQQSASPQYQQNNSPSQYSQNQQNASPQYQQNNGPSQYSQNQQNASPQYQQNNGPSQNQNQQNASPQYQQNNGPSTYSQSQQNASPASNNSHVYQQPTDPSHQPQQHSNSSANQPNQQQPNTQQPSNQPPSQPHW